MENFLTVKSAGCCCCCWCKRRVPGLCGVLVMLLEEVAFGSKILSRFRSFIAVCWTANVTADSSLNLQGPLALFEVPAATTSDECDDSFDIPASWHSRSIPIPKTKMTNVQMAYCSPRSPLFFDVRRRTIEADERYSAVCNSILKKK